MHSELPVEFAKEAFFLEFFFLSVLMILLRKCDSLDMVFNLYACTIV